MEPHSAAPPVRLYQAIDADAYFRDAEPGYTLLGQVGDVPDGWGLFGLVRRFLEQNTLEDGAYYGFLPSRFRDDTGLTPAQITAFVQRHAASADVLLFSPLPDMSGLFLNCFEQADSYDPGFTTLAEAALAATGRARPLRAMVMDARQMVYGNGLVASAAFWRRWLAFNQPLFALCEGPPNPLQPQLLATSKHFEVQRKVLLVERTTSLLLTTEPQWRSKLHNPFGNAPSETRLSGYPVEAVLSDALKIAIRTHGFAEYSEAFDLLRERLSLQLPPLVLQDALPPQQRLRFRPGSIPVVVISYNNHVFVQNTLQQLRQRGVQDIVVIDNASTRVESQRLLTQLAGQPDCQVLRNHRNAGHLCWQQPAFFDQLPDRFCVTDADLQFHPRLPDNFIDVLSELADRFNAMRVGFALDISDHDLMYQDKDYCEGRSIFEWESLYWQQRLKHETLELYYANIDTTFHLYNKHGDTDMRVRVAGDYTARHLPWYRNNPVADVAEMSAMYRRASRVSTSARLHFRLHGSAGAAQAAEHAVPA